MAETPNLLKGNLGVKGKKVLSALRLSVITEMTRKPRRINQGSRREM